jgi:two-component system phosphate regulon sensor histidine kinase PhoR
MDQNLFRRRLLVPVLVILVCAVALVVIIGAIWSGVAIWIDSAVALAAISATVIIARSYVRAQARELLDQISQSLGPSRTSGPAPTSMDEAIHSVSQSVSTAITQASTGKAQLMTIISSMSEGLIAIDHRQRILLTNRAAEQLLGLPVIAAGQLLWDAVKSPHVLELVSQVKLTGRRQTIDAGPIDGRYLQITVARLSADRYPGLVIVAHDITEARQYEELRKEFVANVSHELRTPLTVIMGFVETLQDGALQDPERAVRFLATVAKHTGQLRNLVDDLLDLSRLDSGAHLPAREPTDLANIVRRVADLAAPGARARSQSVSLKLDEPLPKVLGNSDLLQRAIANLLDNAIKYTPDGGSVTLSLHGEESEVVFRVTDTGIGIDAEHLPRVFERFYRVDKSRSREMGGTGLGLSIVKHVVQAHAGSIDVSSEAGKGTQFEIRLEALESSAPVAPAVS